MDAPHELVMTLLSFAKPMAMNAMCKLGIPDILNRAGSNAFMSVEEIAERLPSDRVDATSLSRILDGCVTFGLLADKSEDSNGILKRYYGLNALSSLLVQDGNPRSLAPMVTMQMHPVAQAPWLHFADTVLTGAYPFAIAHGKSAWEKARDDSEWNTVLNEAMAALSSSMSMEAIVGKYDGFKDVKTLVDVGGGTGRMLQMVVKKHPHLHGVVFDLPHAIAEASHVEGVEYVGGDMFQSVPSGDAIFMKMIMHDWDDERCIEILRNCMAALPDHGKVIISDAVVPEESTSFKVLTTCYDLTMLAHCDGGKERTKAQWTKLLTDAGFARIQFVQVSASEGVDQWLIEGYKTG